MIKIFILHGWAYSTEKWEPFLTSLRKRGFDPIMLPIPGLTEKTDKVWTLDDYIEWLKEKVNKEKQVILLGHSNGGRIALAFAAKYPTMLRYLLLIDSAGIYHNHFSIRMKRLVFGSAAKVGKQIFGRDAEKLRNVLYRIAREKDYKQADPNLRQTMINLVSKDLTEEIGRVVTPTLLVWGKYDKATPLTDGEKMHHLINGSKLYIIDEARHSPQFTHPDKIVEKIVQEVN